jgi:hypothetical protein
MSGKNKTKQQSAMDNSQSGTQSATTSSQSNNTATGVTSQVGNTSQSQDLYRYTGPEQAVRDEGMDIYATAKGLIDNDSGAYTGQRVADFGGDFTNARDLIAAMADGPSQDLAGSRSALSQLRSSINLGQSTADRMNPYTSAALAPVLRELGIANDQRRMGTQAAATMSGAFGDARHGVEDAIADKDYLTAIGDRTSQAYASAWDKAQAQENAERQMLGSTVGMGTALDGAENSRGSMLSQLLAGFADKQRGVDQAKLDATKAASDEARDRPLALQSALMQLLKLMPQGQESIGNTTAEGTTSANGTTNQSQSGTASGKTDGTFQSTGSSFGTQVNSSPDNTGLALLGKLGGTLLGSMFGPAGAGIGGGLMSNLFGGGGGESFAPGGFMDF